MQKFYKTDSNHNNHTKRVGHWFLATDMIEAISIAAPYGVDELGGATKEEVERWNALTENDTPVKVANLRFVPLPDCCGSCVSHWPLIVINEGACVKQDLQTRINQLCDNYERREKV